MVSAIFLRLKSTKRRAALCLVCVGVMVAAVALARAADAPKGELIAPKDLPGHIVNIKMQEGEDLSDVQIEKVREGDVPGTIRMITVRDRSTNKTRTLLANMVASISAGSTMVPYTFDANSKRLMPDDPKLRDKLKQRQANSEANPFQVSKEDRDKVAAEPERSHSKSSRTAGERKNKKASNELPLRNGVKAWEVQSKEDREKAVVKQKEYLKKVQEVLPQIKLRLYETEYFLFASDLSPQDLQLYVPFMDAMYKRMNTIFELKQGTNIWYGKCVVLVFATKQSYVSYESQMAHLSPDMVEHTAGLFHTEGTQDAYIAGHTSNATRLFLAHVLVHETTHAYLWRYKTTVDVPSWANEGLAEVIAQAIVPGDDSTRNREKMAVAIMKQTGSLGAGFFSRDNIRSDQYGMASSMTSFMISSNPRRYKLFIEGIKSGMTDEESLKNAFGANYEQLTALYGRNIGVPNLTP